MVFEVLRMKVKFYVFLMFVFEFVLLYYWLDDYLVVFVSKRVMSEWKLFLEINLKDVIVNKKCFKLLKDEVRLLKKIGKIFIMF